MDIQKQADEIRANILAQRADETPSDTISRWKKATEKRDKAMKKVFVYQDSKGMPQDKEMNDEFAVESGLGSSFDEVEKKGQEEEK